MSTHIPRTKHQTPRPAPPASRTGHPTPRAPGAPELRAIRWLLIALPILAVIYTLALGRTLFVPIMLAFLVSLVLAPAVRWLERHRIPRPLGAGAAAPLNFIPYLGAVMTASARCDSLPSLPGDERAGCRERPTRLSDRTDAERDARALP